MPKVNKSKISATSPYIQIVKKSEKLVSLLVQVAACQDDIAKLVTDMCQREPISQSNRRKQMDVAVSSPPNWSEVEGDLLTTPVYAIAHQCNCVTDKLAMRLLSGKVFTAFPHADIYSGRTTRCVPGSVHVARQHGQKTIVNIMGQLYPGGAKYDNDSAEKRLQWFISGLTTLRTELPELMDPNFSIAFPDKIGCGAAKGNWDDYKSILLQFAASIHAQVVLVKYKPSQTKLGMFPPAPAIQ